MLYSSIQTDSTTISERTSIDKCCVNQNAPTCFDSSIIHTNSKDFFKSKLNFVDTKKIIDFCNSHFLTKLVPVLTIPKYNVGKIPLIKTGTLDVYKDHHWNNIKCISPFGREIINSNMAIIIPDGMIVVDIDNQCKEENNNGIQYFTTLLQKNTNYLTIEDYCKGERINYTSTPSSGYHLYYKYTPNFYKRLKSTFINCGAIDIKKEGEFVIAPYSVYQGCHPSKVYNKESKQYGGEDLTPHKCGGTNECCYYKGNQYIPYFNLKPDLRELTHDEISNLEDYFKEVPIWIKNEFEEDIKFNYTLQNNTIEINPEDLDMNDNTNLKKKTNKDKVLSLIECCKDMFINKRTEWSCIVWTIKSIFIQIFNNEEEGREIVHKYSSLDTRYTYSQTDTLFNNGKPTSNPISLLHYLANNCNPEKYDKIQNPITVEINFTPTKIISEKYIPLETYTECDTEVLAIQSNMKTGKTYCIPDYINHLDHIKSDNIPTKILIVLFRISLVDSLHKNWKDLNFTNYKDISNEKVISSNVYPRLIIQFDSLHKVIGKYDLLILDEIESTTSHLSNGFVKLFQPCFTRFMDYCQKVPKVITMDATLQDQTLSTIFQNRSITKVKNDYKSFSDYNAKFTHDKSYFEYQLMQELKNGKKIILPSTCAQYAIRLKELCKDITVNNKLIKIGIKTADIGQDITTDEWSNFDLFIYSPTIVAGISFDIIHFDMCFAYFNNNSCDAEMMIQMLVRVRNLKDKVFNIYTPHSSESIKKPIYDEELNKYINTLIRTGDNHVDISNLNISAYDELVIQDTFFLLFRKMLKKKHITTLNTYGYIRKILVDHGIKCSMWKVVKDELIQKECNTIKDLLENIGKRLNVEYIQEICNATPIDNTTFEEFINKHTIHLTHENQKSIQRYLYTDTFNIPYNANLEASEVIKKF